MKRLILLLMAFVLAFPALAQSLDGTYTFEDTGTRINYPSDWDAELSNQVLILDNGEQRAIVIDYPFVNLLLLDADEPGLAFLVEAITNQIVDDEIDTNDIYFFDMEGRQVATYDITQFQVSANVYALEFTNGGIGMLVAVNIDEQTANAMLESFDSAEPLITNVSADTPTVRDEPGAYIFQTEGRFIVPADWSVQTRINGDLEYAVTISPDEDLTVMLFSLNEVVTSGTELIDVIQESEINWADDYDIDFVSDEPDTYDLGEREAISYPIEVGRDAGQLVVLRFSNDMIAVAVLYGDLDIYEQEIALILGSFNNLEATLEYMS